MTPALESKAAGHADLPIAPSATRLTMSAQLQTLWRDVFDKSRVVQGGSSQPDLRQHINERFPQPQATRNTAGPDKAGKSNTSRSEALRESVSSASAPTVKPALTTQEPRPKALPTVRSRAYGPHSTAQTISVPNAISRSTAAESESTTSTSSGVPQQEVTEDRPTQHPSPASILEGDSAQAVPLGQGSSNPGRVQIQRPNKTSDVNPPGIEGAPSAETADEIVQVYESNGDIQIVIRDSALDSEAALCCAMETARHLSGDTRTLRHVTLNGRAVFDRDAEDGRLSPPLLVSFSC